MKAHTLDIMIPTYNRGTLLKACIQAAVQHCNSNECLITVVDNNSRRDIPELRSTRAHAVKYVCNYANITANANFVRCAALQTGHYFMLLGDDDLLLPAFYSVTDLLKISSCRLAVFDGKGDTNEYITSFNAFLRQKLWNPCEFGELWHITSFIYSRGSFGILEGLKHLNTMYPHAWATIGGLLYNGDDGNWPVLVLPSSKYLKISGIQNPGICGRPTVDSDEDYSNQLLEKTFQCSLFTLWSTAWRRLIDPRITIERLKHFYCKATDRRYSGSYSYLMNLIEYNADWY